MPIERRWWVGLQIVAGIALFFMIDAAVFGSGWYFQWVRHQSTLGSVAQAIANARHVPAGQRAIIALGDSRVGEGFSTKIASEEASKLGAPFAFVNGAVGGTSPRAWYYFLRQMQLSPGRVAAVVVMATSYHDTEPAETAGLRTDLSVIHPLLRLTDLPTMLASFPWEEGRTEAIEALLLRGYLYKNDVMDFLGNPRDRIRDVLLARLHGTEWIESYPGRDESLAGIRFDMATGTLTGQSDQPRTNTAPLGPYTTTLRAFAGRLPHSARAEEYRRRWFGKLAELCRAHAIPLFMYRIPRGPLHFLADPDAQPSGVLEQMQAEGLVTLLAATLFNHLEQPQYFFDSLHLNSSGRKLFSTELTEALLRRLPKPQ